MAGRRDPNDTPAGMPKNQRSPKKVKRPVFAFAGDDERAPANVVIVGRPTKRGYIRVLRPDLDVEFSAALKDLTPPQGFSLPE